MFGNVLVKEDFLRTVGNPTTGQQGTMTSVYNLGCFAGALSTLYTGDKLGRPRTIMVGSTVIALGAIVQASVYSAGQMYAGRVIAGKENEFSTDTKFIEKMLIIIFRIWNGYEHGDSWSVAVRN